MKEITKSEIDKEIKFLYKIPDDFEFFVEKIYKNLEFFLKSYKYRSIDPSNNILSSFILYMLEKNRNGISRYKSYDKDKYGNIPYYKWFLNNLKFFGLKYKYSQKKEDERLDKVQFTLSSSRFIGQETILFFGEIEKFLLQYSEGKYTQSNFDKNVYNLFMYKMLDFSNGEIADILRMKVSIIYTWIDKLKILIKKFLGLNFYCLNC
jgi:hypothetical protein